MNQCPYCSITDVNNQVVFERELVMFIQNELYQGALEHSGVIIPKAHKETVFDLSEAEVLATFALVHEVKRWLDANFSPSGYNLGWNCGPSAGQEVMHAHLHVMPRFSDEPLAGTGIRTLLKSSANAR